MYFLAKKEYDYAIRICAYLAGAKRNVTYTIRELSKKLLISKPFATKIIYQLKKGGIVKTFRGNKGGVALNVPAESLSLFDVVESVGLTRKLSECVLDKDFCPLPAPCKIHKFFIDEEAELIRKLKSNTLNNFAFSDDDIK